MSQCDSNSIISDEFLPTYCTDSSKTDQDHFCCDKNYTIIEQNHVGDDVPHLKEPPIFTKANDKPWPCVDHTKMCKTWAKTHPDSCKPGDDHYEFMKLACMESCQICKDHVSKTRKNIFTMLFNSKNISLSSKKGLCGHI